MPWMRNHPVGVCTRSGTVVRVYKSKRDAQIGEGVGPTSQVELVTLGLWRLLTAEEYEHYSSVLGSSGAAPPAAAEPDAPGPAAVLAEPDAPGPAAVLAEPDAPGPAAVLAATTLCMAKHSEPEAPEPEAPEPEAPEPEPEAVVPKAPKRRRDDDDDDACFEARLEARVAVRVARMMKEERRLRAKVQRLESESDALRDELARVRRQTDAQAEVIARLVDERSMAKTHRDVLAVVPMLVNTVQVMQQRLLFSQLLDQTDC